MEINQDISRSQFGNQANDEDNCSFTVDLDDFEEYDDDDKMEWESCTSEVTNFDDFDDDADEDEFDEIHFSDYEEEKDPIDEKLYSEAPLTVGESIMLILSLFLRHKLTGTCLSDILKLIALHCPQANRCVKSMYFFKKYLKQLGSPIMKHYYCSGCCTRVETIQSVCTVCQTRKKNNYFIEIPILSSLATLFSRPGFADKLLYRFHRKKSNENYEDIFDGEIYRSQVDNGFLSNKFNISFTWNSDGISIFKSAKFSIWPVYLVINELPYLERFRRENTILAGIWFGTKKPHIPLFMNAFRDQLEKLYHGVDLRIHDWQITHCVRGMVLAGTLDAQAKALFFNQYQYNGFHGCQCCTAPGVQCQGIHVYPYEETSNLRTTEKTIEYAKKALDENKSVYGVKGPTPLANIIYRYIESTAIDSMHCVFEGVVSKLISLWFDSDYHTQDWSLSKFVHVVSKRLTSINCPSFVQRLTRSLSDYHYWKASEFKNWLFYYSVPILCDLMPEKYFNHHLLLVQAMLLLHSPSISEEHIELASLALNLYVRQFQELYGLKHMVSNVHNLLHLPTVVRRLGPLWVTSCFPFENLNGLLKRLIHGTKYAELQICSAVTLFANSAKLKADNLTEDTAVHAFCSEMDKSTKNRRKLTHISHGISIVGKCTKLKEMPNFISTTTIVDSTSYSRWYIFYRLLKNGTLYDSEMYSRRRKTNSSCVTYNRRGFSRVGIVKTFIKMVNCLCDKSCDQCNINSKFYALVIPCSSKHVFQTPIDNIPLLSTSLCEKLIDEPLVAVPVEDLETVCFQVDIHDREVMYVIEPVNRIEFE